jgi:maltose O-acetyltransferase
MPPDRRTFVGPDQARVHRRRETPILLQRIVKSVRNRARLNAMRLRGEVARYLWLGAVRAGSSLFVGRDVRLVVYGQLVLGNDVYLSDGCALEVGPRGRLVLGDRTFVGRNTVIVAQESVEIADRVLIAEHCSVRDQDHHVDPEMRASETRAVTGPVVLESNVWIGAGVRILRGCRVGSGSVIAANAVVRQSIPPNVVAGGIPARILGPVSDPERR